MIKILFLNILKIIPIRKVKKSIKTRLYFEKNKYLQELNKSIEQSFAEDKVVVYCSASMGDTFFFCGFIPEIEKQKKVRIFPIFRSSHAFIAKLFSIKEFGIVKAWDDVIKLPIIWKEYGFLQSPYDLGKINPRMRKGKIFIAQPPFLNWNNQESIFPQHPFKIKLPEYQYTNETLMEYTKKYLGISKKSKWSPPRFLPSVSDEFKKKINKLNSLQKIVLICPEHSAQKIDFSLSFWIKEIEPYLKKGFTVIQNTIQSSNIIPGAIWINMSTEELMWLGLNCHLVISTRSGICDLLYSKGHKGLIVLYPSMKFFKITNLTTIFKKKFNEIIVENKF